MAVAAENCLEGIFNFRVLCSVREKHPNISFDLFKAAKMILLAAVRKLFLIKTNCLQRSDDEVMKMAFRHTYSKDDDAKDGDIKTMLLLKSNKGLS